MFLLILDGAALCKASPSRDSVIFLDYRAVAGYHAKSGEIQQSKFISEPVK